MATKKSKLHKDLSSAAMADLVNAAAEGETPGEISKNALKKMQKAEEAAKKKAEKEAEKKAKAAEQPEKKEKVGGDDAEELDPTQYYENRLRAINHLEVRPARCNFPSPPTQRCNKHAPTILPSFTRLLFD